MSDSTTLPVTKADEPFYGKYSETAIGGLSRKASRFHLYRDCRYLSAPTEIGVVDIERRGLTVCSDCKDRYEAGESKTTVAADGGEQSQ